MRTNIRQRLYPSRFSARFHSLRMLRIQIESMVGKHVVNRREQVLVDFGCGIMPYRSVFEPLVAQYIGVDLPGNDLADCEILRDGTTGLGSAIADVVLSTQVLEHVEDPAGYLRECRRLLKDDGILILSTHGYWMYHPNPTDFWRWTGSGLCKSLQLAGFEVLELEGIMGLAATATHLLQDSLMSIIPARLRPLFAFVMQSLVVLMDKMYSQDQLRQEAAIYVIVAAKDKLSGV